MKIATVSLAAFVWVLLTMHCRIEVLTGLEFLRCATEAHETDASHADSAPCQEDGCCSFESAQFHAPRQQHDLAASVQAILPSNPQPGLEPVRDDPSPIFSTAPPPELAPRWQFHCRTALPPRAPSVLS